MSLDNLNRASSSFDDISASELANAIAAYAFSYDTYEYWDNVPDQEQFTAALETDIRNGNTQPLLDYLKRDIEERDDVDGLHAAAEVLIGLLTQYQLQQKQVGFVSDVGTTDAHRLVPNHSKPICNLETLCDTVTQVVNHVLETEMKNISSDNIIVRYDDVAHLISKDDFNRYFHIISGEIGNREVGFTLAPLSEGVIASAADIAQEKHPDLIDISCYADQVLPKTDRSELIEQYDCALFTVPRSWAESMAKEAGYRDVEEFLDDYTWDTTDGWFERAFHDGVLSGISLGVTAFNTREADITANQPREKPSLDDMLSKAKETAQTDRMLHSEGKDPERD